MKKVRDKMEKEKAALHEQLGKTEAARYGN